MDTTDQQKQVKDIFEDHSEKWFSKAKDETKPVNVIKQRNQFIEKLALKFLKKNDKILDVGCGTGDLVISLLQKNFDAYGIDFVPSMIERAESEALKLSLPKDKFKTVSFFDFTPNTSFNLISANGFIEYISENQLKEFIKKSNDYLKNDGILAFSSRNRLFNVNSFNEYTKDEIQLGTIKDLLDECILLNSVKSFEEFKKAKFVSKLSKNLEYHDYSGSDIKVEKRFQYTPSQLISLLNNNNFDVINLYPIHVHIFPLATRNEPAYLHDNVSNYIQNLTNIPISFILQSSSFMIAARRL